MSEFEKLVSDLGTKLEAKLDQQFNELKQMIHERQTTKDYYTPQEVAEKLSKTADTVREWCRTRRIEAVKQKGTGRGGEEEWRIPHKSLEHYWNFGLIPLERRQYPRI